MDFNKQYKEELFDSEVYLELGKKESDPIVKAFLFRMAEMEKKHASIWKEISEKRGIRIGKLGIKDKLMIKLYGIIRKVLGLELTLRLLESNEENDIEKYNELAKSEELDENEREKMREISIDEAVHEEMLTTIKAKDVSDFVYGISDGLIEVLAATSGIAGAVSNPLIVALSGLIVGISGTFSMSIGAYLSTKSEKEINEHKREKVKIQKLVDRGEVSKKLSQILSELGIKDKIAQNISPQLVDVAEDIIAPKIEESPLKSSAVTGLSYIVGAIIPLIPYFLRLGGMLGLITSYVISGISIFFVGFMIGLLSDVNPKKKGLEMMGLGIGAAIVTHLIGLLASLVI
ncbi:VIT1/CCC1 transporter family protein [Stygiolobus azoricus]|uniref:Rubrerythrin family protein n=1 Tax=Stygiolobus azoricus TaxID=41675 RepID=A0A650CP89_9CREN|nr:VIT1/CCC1 transporter family protein [Stygiolobus azoricus]QGR19515.1 rubrerythrin family protein [Stygiolobus azoricus]